MDDLHYRGQNAMDVQRTGHSIGTRALLVVLATLPGRKKLSASSKACCLRLLTQLVRTAVESRGTSGVNGGCVSCTIFSKDWRPHSLDLQFSSAGLTSGLGSLEDCKESCPELEAAHTGSSSLVWSCFGLHFAAGHPLGCDSMVNLGQAPPSSASLVTSLQALVSQAHLFCWSHCG